MLTSYPDISVIVPVHNSSRYLGECLDSILRQTHKNIEIICINDGSCDHSGQILKDYRAKDARIKVITTDCHGVGSARNRGIDIAKAPYIFFADSDDVLHREALSNLIKIAMTSNADIVCAKYKKVKNPRLQDERKLLGDFSLNTNPISCFGQRPPQTPITVWNKLFKREVIEKVRFIPKVFFEDTAFTLDVFSKANTCALCQDVTYFYRTGNSSIMRSHITEQKINDFCSVLRTVDRQFQDKPDMHRLIFSTYLNPELLSLLYLRFWISKHLRRYMHEQVQPVIRSIQKNTHTLVPNNCGINGKNCSKTRLLWEILKGRICKN